MNAYDLDPNYLLPLWRALVSHFGRHAPVVHGHGALRVDAPAPARRRGERRKPIRRSYLPKDLERRLPIQPSP